jgi:hypothetical protein
MQALILVQLAIIALAAFVDMYFGWSSVPPANHSPTPPSQILVLVFMLGCIIFNVIREQNNKIKLLKAEITELQKKFQTETLPGPGPQQIYRVCSLASVRQ